MIQANEQHEEPSPLREAECPKCKALFLFQRARVPHFDEQGFETYKLVCKFCRASLAGIIDPSDGALLLSVVERNDRSPLEQPSGQGAAPPPNISDRRAAHAAEFSAEQLGQINNEIDRIIEAIKELVDKLK